MLGLQAAAGNRATAEALGHPSVQRAPGAATTNAGGELRIGGDTIPIQTASWSIRQEVGTMQSGQSRRPAFHPVGIEFGEIVITRDADGQSGALSSVMEQAAAGDGATARLDGALRLDRPSRDGHLPATTLQLRGVGVLSLQLHGGEHPTETVVLSVESLAAAGTAPAAPKGKPVGSLTLDAGAGDPSLPMPVMDWEEARPPRVGRRTDDEPAPAAVRVRAHVVAGTMLSRLTRVLTQAARPTFVFRGPGGKEQTFVDVIVERIGSSGDGAEVIELAFLAEQRTEGSPPRR